MKKKCLLINNAYPTIQNPNCSTYTKSIENCLRRSGLEVDLLVIKYQRQITLIYKVLKYVQFWLKLLFVNQNRYDYIYLNIPPYAWPLFLNPTYKASRVINHWHGDEVVVNTLFLRFAKPFVVGKTKTCTYVVPSKYFERVLLNEFKINKNMIMISPSGGVDINAFKCNKRLIGDTLILGFSSGMSKSKGSDMVMLLINHKEDIEKIINHKVIFKIIDYGSDMSVYKNELTNNKCVQLVQKMSKEMMPCFYNGIDILLMCSKRSESLGLVVLEAMSCNKPVIGFNMFAFPEFVISGVSGELVNYSQNEYENINKIISAIEKVVCSYENYDPRSIIVRNYSSEVVINQYKNIFKC